MKKTEWSDQNRTKLILFILILIIATLLSAQEDQILTVDSNKMYFSVGGNVHWKYFTATDSEHWTPAVSKYMQRLTAYHMYRKREIGHQSYHAIAVNLPDSLLGDNLNIKKGYYAVNVDSVISFKFDIHNFVTEINTEAGGHIGPYFTVPKTYMVDSSNLFIVSPDKKTLNKIIPIKMDENNDSEINRKIADLVSDYFLINEKAFYVQYFHDIESEDLLITEFTKEKISQLFKLSNYYINDNCSLIVGINNIEGTKINDHQHKFIAIVNGKTNYISLLTNTHLLQTFKINNEMYLYYASVGKHTGAIEYKVSKIVENELESIFSDGSFSM